MMEYIPLDLGDWTPGYVDLPKDHPVALRMMELIGPMRFNPPPDDAAILVAMQMAWMGL